MSEPPENTPEYISDNWYLKDQNSENKQDARSYDGPHTTRDFVSYIQENGSEKEQAALLTLEVEFSQKVLDLLRTVRNRKTGGETKE